MYRRKNTFFDGSLPVSARDVCLRHVTAVQAPSLAGSIAPVSAVLSHPFFEQEDALNQLFVRSGDHLSGHRATLRLLPFPLGSLPQSVPSLLHQGQPY